MKFGEISSETLVKRIFGCSAAIAVLLNLPLLIGIFAPHGDMNIDYGFLFFIHAMNALAVATLSVILIKLVCDVIYRILKKVEPNTQKIIPETVEQNNEKTEND